MSTINGTSGNDIFFPASNTSGPDDFNGGEGFDEISLDEFASGAVVVNLAAGTASGPVTGNDTFTSIEEVSVRSYDSITIIGDSGDNFLQANGTGPQYLSGEGGTDEIWAGGDYGSILDGGSGQNGLDLDRSYLNRGVAGSRKVATSFAFTFSPGVSGTLQDGTVYSNFEFLYLTTGAGNDDVSFKFNQPELPVFWRRYDLGTVAVLSDWWDAGAGTDTVTVDLSGSNVSYTMTAPLPNYNGIEQYAKIQVTSTGAEFFRLSHVENFRLIGGSAGDNFTTGGGTDILTGGGGNDTLDGGEGADVARYSGLSGDYRIDQLSGTSFQITDLRSGSPDGVDTLSNIERLQWSDGGYTNLFNGPPVVQTQTIVMAPGQSRALLTLANASDPDGNGIIKFQIRDNTSDAASGYFTINGVRQAAGTAIDVTPAQFILGAVSFVAGSVGDNLEIRAWDGNRWSAVDSDPWSSFYVAVNRAPTAQTANLRVGAGQALSLSSLVTVSDGDQDPILKYQLWDSTRDPNSGYFVVNGVAQAAGTVIEVTGAQIAQTRFVTGTVSDRLEIRAFDGLQWSAGDTAAWSPFSVTINRPPVLTTQNINVAAGQTRSLSSLISVTDPDGDAITKYQLWDSTRDSNSGHFVVNGVARAAGTVIEVTAAQLAQTSFVTGTVNDYLEIRASDGAAWSAADTATWSPFLIGPTVNRAPVLTTGPVSGRPGQSLTLSSMVSLSDADGDTMQKYQLWDAGRDPASGHFVVNGVAQPAGTIIEITAAQAAQTSFVVGTVGDGLQVRTFDGQAWSAGDNAVWAPFTVSVTNAAPVVTTSDVSRTHNQTLALSSLFSVSDADSDTITWYQLWDSNRDPASGHFVVNGVAQAAGTVIDITAAQLAQTSFVTGAVGDRLEIRAFDGIGWSAGDNAMWSPFTVTVPANNVPVVTTSNVTRAHLQTLSLSSLFSASDADGDTITRYQLWDSNRDPASGHFVVNGVAQSAATVIDITAAQLAQTSFVTGAVGDRLEIRAYDGIDWSAAENASWSPFTVTVPANNAPVVTTADLTRAHQQTLALSSLFSASDADGDAITKYQLWDSGRDPASGHFVVNGVAQAAGTVIEISAAQLAQTSFVTGMIGDRLEVRAFDGMTWSAGDTAAWSPFAITVPANSAPVITTADVSTTPGQSLALSSLFTPSDADGDTLTRYQLWDSTRDPASGHFVVNGVAQAAGTVIDITAAQLAQTSFLAGSVNDSLQIRAFDGFAWSAGDNAAWSPFHVTV